MFYQDYNSTANVQRVAPSVERQSDRESENLEREQDAFEVALAHAEEQVTFNEVLKRLRSLKSARKAELMQHMEHDPAHFRWTLEHMFRDAFADQCNRRARRELSRLRHVELHDEA